MSSRHRFLQRSINHVSLHNRITEEDAMWRRREQERDEGQQHKRRYRSRSPYEKRKQPLKKHRRSSSSSTNDNNDEKKKSEDIEFGPPLPSNLGINADRWDHAFFMERYPKEYEKQVGKSKRKQSTSSDDEKSKKKHHRHKRKEKTNENIDRKVNVRLLFVIFVEY